MKQIHTVEALCNGCRLCESFCSSLSDGVFSGRTARVRIARPPGDERAIPIVDCAGDCIRSIYDDGRPTCVGLCPTGALIFADQERAFQARVAYEKAREAHSIFRIVAPWKWPFPWRRPGEKRARSAEEEIV